MPAPSDPPAHPDPALRAGAPEAFADAAPHAAAVRAAAAPDHRALA